MNLYELTQKSQQGTCVIGTAQATTQAQAARKLYRAHNVDKAQAAELGYKVCFKATAAKGQNRG